MRRWRRLKWHSCGGLWIKDESFDLAPSFLSPVAHLNYYKGGLEGNRVSKVHTKEELMWERSRKFFIFNTWRTMTDTSESNRVPKHKVTWQYAEAQPTFHAVLSWKKKRSSVMAHLNQSRLESNGLFQHTKLSVCALFLKAERHDSVYFFDHSCFTASNNSFSPLTYFQQKVSDGAILVRLICFHWFLCSNKDVKLCGMRRCSSLQFK